nr:hypothetical protein [Naasia aerilata]
MRVVAGVQRVVVGEAQDLGVVLDHGDPEALRDLDQLRHRGLVAAEVRGHQHGALGALQIGDELVHELFGRGDRGHRRPLGRRGLRARHHLGEHLARAGEVDGASGCARRELEAAQHELRHIAPGPDVVAPLHVLADERVLVGGVLQVVDVGVAGSGQLTLERVGREPREDEHGHPRPRGVVHRAAQVGGAHVRVDEHRLRASRDGGVAVRGAQRRVLVRAQDHGGRVDPALPVGGEGLDDCGMVAAEVGEQVLDARIPQRLDEQRGRRRGLRHP